MATYIPQPAQVHGDTAHDSVDANNPVKAGGKAATALPTAVADGDRANLLVDKFGRPVVVADTPDDQRLLATISLTSTTVTTLVGADASNIIDLLAIWFSNTSTTATEMQLLADDGTTVRANFYVPPKEMRGVIMKIPGEGVNKITKVKEVTTANAVKVTCIYTKRPS